MKPDEQRAYDHFRWADRYNRNKEPKKAAAHLLRAVKLQRGARFGAPDPGSSKKLVLLEPIYGGISQSPVFHATVDGEPAVCKVMSKSELASLKAAQGDRVARILHVSEDFAAAKGEGADDLRSPYGPFRGRVPPGRAIVAMEKLSDVQFHPRNGQGGPCGVIDTEYALQERAKTGVRYPAHAPKQPTLRSLREFLDAIVDLNARGLMWGDVKQENSGSDREGHLRIYDFGSAGSINEFSRHMDLLAYGKLLYNTLVQSYALGPGSHYESRNVTLGRLSEDKLVFTVDLLFGAPRVVSDALRACFSLTDSSTPSAVATVVILLYKALQELGA